MLDIISLIVSAVTAFAALFAAIQIKISRKQLFFSTITKCIADFRDLGTINKSTINEDVIHKYIDLTNEELFYFQQDYIPKDISKEWIDGMIDFLPLTNSNGIVLNHEFVIGYILENKDRLLQSFPRIKNAFEIKGNYNFILVYTSDSDKRQLRVEERNKLINEILNNIKRFKQFV